MGDEIVEQQSLLHELESPPAPGSIEDPPQPPQRTLEQVEAELAEERRLRELAENAAEQTNRALTQVTSMRREEPRPAPPSPPDPRPDPEEQPEAYAAWERRQSATAMRSAVGDAIAPVHQRLDGMEQAYRMERVWDEFQREFPQYRGCEESARVAFNLEFPDGQVPADGAEIKRRVAKRMETMAGQLAPRPPTPPPPTSEVDLTAGLSAGSGARPTPPKNAAKEPKIKTLTDMIRERQDKSPFFR